LYAGPEVDIWSCGIILYALLTGTLPFDDESVQVLFKKIRSGVYMTPDYLSRPVAKLIEHMLTVDPLKRATIKEILENEWFKNCLPDYLFPNDKQENLSLIDVDAVFEICEKFSVDEQSVQKSLMEGDSHNQYVIAYHLIIDNRRMTEAQNRIQINDFFVASSPPTTSFYMDMTSGSREHPERMPQLKDVSATLDEKLGVHSIESQIGGEIRKPVKKAKWHLGIRSQSKPQDIMNEVFKAMKACNMKWKYYNSSIYSLRVRKQVGPNRYVKIGLQLYQVDQKSFLLDFRSFESSPEELRQVEEMAMHLEEMADINHHNMMEFFELCASLIGSLAR